ncbi:DsbA family protein [Flexivirga sp. B27]
MPRPDASQRLAATKPKDGPSKGLIGGIIAAVIVVVIVVAVFVTQANKSGSFAGAVPKGGTDNADGLRAYPDVKLKSGAPTVDIYEDFQCPICNELEKSNGEQILKMAKAGQIKLQWHLMTFLEDNFRNAPASTVAANGLYCAADAGKAAEYHKAAFAGQRPEQQEMQGDTYTTSDIKKYGKQAGIKGAALTKFNSCVTKKTYNKYVAATMDNAGKNGVTGTPTMFINGDEYSQSKHSTEYGQLLGSKNSFKAILEKATK